MRSLPLKLHRNVQFQKENPFSLGTHGQPFPRLHRYWEGTPPQYGRNLYAHATFLSWSWAPRHHLLSSSPDDAADCMPYRLARTWYTSPVISVTAMKGLGAPPSCISTKTIKTNARNLTEF